MYQKLLKMFWDQKYQEVLDLCKKVLEYDSKNYKVMNMQLICEYELGKCADNEDTIMRFRAILVFCEDYAPTLYNISRIYRKMGNDIRELEYLDKVIESEPSFLLARERLVDRYIDNREFHKAEEHLQILLALDESDSNLMRMAFFAIHHKQLDEAITFLQKVLEIDKINYVARRNLIICFGKQEQWDQVLKQADEALELDGNEIIFLSYKVAALYNLERFDEIIPVHNKMTSLDPTNSNFLDAVLKANKIYKCYDPEKKTWKKGVDIEVRWDDVKD